MRALSMAGDVGGIDPAHPGLLAPVAAIFGAMLGAVGLWLANRLLGKAAFQTAINDGFSKLTQELQQERAALQAELNTERLRWAAERATLQGEIRNLTQVIESLKAELRRRGVPITEAGIGGREPDAGALILEDKRDRP